MKKIKLSILIAVTLFIFFANAEGAQYSRIFINDKLLPPAQNALMEDYRNYIPQDVLESKLGFKLWKDSVSGITYIYKNKNLITIAKDGVFLNWKHIKTDRLPKVIDDKIYVPVSMVRILHDVPILWNDRSKFVRIPTAAQAVYETVYGITYSQVESNLIKFYGVELSESLKRNHEAASIDGVFPPINPKKHAFLTFDDGPDVKVTPEVLDTLKQYGLKATFFMLGSYMDEHPDLAKRVFLEGHSIGNHSYTHKIGNLSSLSSFKNEIKKTNEAIKKITGSYPSLFRSPYGNRMSKSYIDFLHEQGLRVIEWNVESGDSRGKNVAWETIYGNVANSLGGSRDIVIIMHDGPGHSESAKALRSIIKVLWQNNYEILPITDVSQINAKIERK